VNVNESLVFNIPFFPQSPQALQPEAPHNHPPALNQMPMCMKKRLIPASSPEFRPTFQPLIVGGPGAQAAPSSFKQLHHGRFTPAGAAPGELAHAGTRDHQACGPCRSRDRHRDADWQASFSSATPGAVPPCAQNTQSTSRLGGRVALQPAEAVSLRLGSGVGTPSSTLPITRVKLDEQLCQWRHQSGYNKAGKGWYSRRLEKWLPTGQRGVAETPVAGLTFAMLAAELSGVPYNKAVSTVARRAD